MTDPRRVWRIVIVEDNLHDRLEVKAALRRGLDRRYEFSEADTGCEGLALIQSAPLPDCLVLDYSLPDMTAVEVLAQLPKEAGLPAMPVVVISDSVSPAVGREILRAGAQGFVGKDWLTPDSLTRIVENAVERYAMAAELRRTTEALAARETLLQAVTDATDNVIFAKDLEGRYILVNRAWRELFGVAEGQGKGLTDEQIVAPELAAELRANDREVMASGQIRRFEESVHGPDGEEVTYQSSKAPLCDAAGHVVGVCGVSTDLTAIKRAEAALRASEELNRSLMNGSADCVKVLDPEGRLLHMNAPGVCQMEIDDFASLYGHDWASLWPEPETVRPALDEARAGRPYSFEAFCPTAKGTPKWWEVTVSPVRDEIDGLVVRLLSVSRDITGRRKAHEALRESEHRLRLALEGAEMGMWEWDLRSDTVVWSPECYQIHGMAVGDFDGTGAGFDRLVHRDDAGRVWATVRAASAGRSLYEAEFRILRPDGEIRWVTNKGRALYDAQGNPTRMIGIITDVTERRQAEQKIRDSEERLRLAQAVARIGTFAYDASRGVTLWTPEMEALYGLAPGAFSGRYEDWLALVHPDDRATYDARIRRAFEAGVYEGEWRAAWPDGTVRWLAGRASLRRQDSNDPGVLVGVNIDVTDAKRIEAEREQLLAAEQAARTEFERVARIKDEFLATLSHELRTPLNAIVGWAQILQRTDPAKERLIQEGINVIARNADNQAQLINDLLDMNRIVSGKLKMEVGPLEPNLLAAAALDTVRPAAEAKGVLLDLSLGTGLPQVTGDEGRLRQVLWNLLTNAVKFTPAGGRVTLSTEAVEGAVRLIVEDTGQGLSPEFLPRLFDRFSQADASAARKHGGLGLGLSIVKQLVELHGGSIAVASEGSGRGSRFTVTLPVGAPVRTDPSTPFPPGPEPAEEIPHLSLRGISILLVEDQVDTLEAVRRLLTEYGASVATAHSSEAALAHLRRDVPQLLLSDIGMPEKDGYQLIREVRGSLGLGPAAMPAVALTAFARPEDRDRAIAAGYQAHVAKPLRPQTLVPTLAALARRRPAPDASEP